MKTCRFSIAVTLMAVAAFAQSDPGPRPGKAGAGAYYPALNAYEQALFEQAFGRFLEVDSVSGTVPGEPGSGLGPAFNGNSCAMCHAQPAIGGSSPGIRSPQNPIANPQVALTSLDGAANALPSFISANGPVREARFVSDGGVHGLFTIAGRTDASGCTLAQPNFAQELANNNLVFRIPTPTFGLGLVENTSDLVLEANLAANASAKAALQIAGKLNTSANDGTVTKFGWKAQNKSLLMFAGEAYNVEQGVSNELFPTERSAVPGCVFNATPEDYTNILFNGSPLGTASALSSDIVNFAIFMRLTAPPAATTSSPSERNGQALFGSIGCALCHTPSLTSGASIYTGMSNATYQPYSDFAVHHMGPGLADGITQGSAGPDEFRTAPLWGVGQRLFFLHDGRTSDLMQAVQAHSNCPQGPPAGRSPPPPCGSEANAVISNFEGLSGSQKQDLLNFLRSL